MADTKNSALAQISPLNGSELLYATKAAASGNIPLSEAAFWIAESKTFFGTSTGTTPENIVSDGTGSPGLNSTLICDLLGVASATGFEATVLARNTVTGDCLYGRLSNAVLCDPGVPSAALIGADTLLVLAASAGAATWTIATTLNPNIAGSGLQGLYFVVIGATGATIQWTVRVVPLRTVL